MVIILGAAAEIRGTRTGLSPPFTIFGGFISQVLNRNSTIAQAAWGSTLSFWGIVETNWASHSNPFSV